MSRARVARDLGRMPHIRAFANDKISFGTHAAYAVGPAGAIALWYQHTPQTLGTSNDARIFALATPSGAAPQEAVELVVGGAVNARGRIVRTVAGAQVASTGNPIKHGKLSRIWVTWGGADLRLYVDGELVTVLTATVPNLTGTPELMLGNLLSFYGTFQPAAGLLGGDLRLYNRKVSAAEIEADYYDDDVPAGAVSAWGPAGWDGSTTVKLTGGAGNNGTITALNGGERAESASHHMSVLPRSLIVAPWVNASAVITRIDDTTTDITDNNAGVYANANAPLISGRPYKVSFSVRKEVGLIMSVDGNGVIGTRINLETGAVSGGNVTTIRDGGDRWNVTAYASGSVANGGIYVYPSVGGVAVNGTIRLYDFRVEYDEGNTDTPLVSRTLGALVDARVSNSMVDFGTHAAYCVGSRTGGGSNGGAIYGYFRAQQPGGPATLGTLFELGTRATTDIIGVRYASGSTTLVTVFAYRAGAALNGLSGAFGHSFKPVPGKLHHVVVTWDNTSFEMYLDGKLVVSVAGDCRPDFASTPRFTVGNWPNAANGFGGGVGGDWRIHNRKLTAGEVLAIYRDGEVPAGCVAAWGPAGWDGTSTVKLTHGSGNNGTVTNSGIDFVLAELTGADASALVTGTGRKFNINADVASWTKTAGCLVTANADGSFDITDPNSGGNAIASATVNTGRYTPPNITVTMEVFVKRTTGNGVTSAFVFYNAHTWPGICYVNTSTGAWSLGSFVPGARVSVLPAGEWWRVLITSQAGSSAAHSIEIYPTQNLGTYSGGFPSGAADNAATGTITVRDVAIYPGVPFDVPAAAPAVGVRFARGSVSTVTAASALVIDGDVTLSAYVRFEGDGKEASNPRSLCIGEFNTGLAVTHDTGNPGKLQVYWGVSGGSLLMPYPATPAPGITELFTVTVQKSTRLCTVYRNGIPVARGIFPGAGALGSFTQPPKLGSSSGAAPLVVSDFRVYKRELSAAEVTALAKGAGPVDMALYWPLDEGVGTTVRDLIASNSGTLTGFTAGKEWVHDL